MKLKEFIKKLEKIARKIDNPKEIEVQMADCAPVVNPILKDKTVFITDIEENEEMKNYKLVILKLNSTENYCLD